MLLTYLEYDTPATPTHPNTSNPSPQNLGYVQGMSDLLSPLYAVFQDDAVAFWAFVAFMRRMARNFVRDQSGMRDQLSTLDQLVQILDPKLYLHLQRADSTNFFFFFRMLLVWYKREFDWPDVLRLWESLWTDYMSSQFHLFLAVAILEKHRDVIMEHLLHFDEVLKYVNELSGTIELRDTLVRAEGLFKRFERTVEAVDRKDSFPAPSGTGVVRQRRDDKDVRRESQSRVDEARAPGVANTAANAAARSSQTAARSSQSAARSSQSDARSSEQLQMEGRDELEKEKVISPQLRLLLSRKMIELGKVDNPEVAESSRVRASGLKD